MEVVEVGASDTTGFSAEVESLWASMLGSLAHEAPDGVQTVFDGGGHYLHTERPRDVAQVIVSLVQEQGS